MKPVLDSCLHVPRKPHELGDEIAESSKIYQRSWLPLLKLNLLLSIGKNNIQITLNINTEIFLISFYTCKLPPGLWKSSMPSCSTVTPPRWRKSAISCGNRSPSTLIKALSTPGESYFKLTFGIFQFTFCLTFQEFLPRARWSGPAFGSFLPLRKMKRKRRPRPSS